MRSPVAPSIWRSFSAVAALAGALLLGSCGGGGGGGPAPGPNAAPSFTSAASIGVTENVTTALIATASDPEGNALTFSVAGGADAARFTMAGTGTLSFATPPDFELASDADGDGVYQVTIRVSDGSNTAEQAVTITVGNSREGIAVRRVATGFNQPLFVSAIPGDSARVYVVEKGGGVHLFTPATGARSQVLSVSDLSTDGERGLLGIAPHPDHATSRKLLAVATAPDGAVEVREYTLGLPQSSTSYIVALRTPHGDFNNHNGGWVGWGPDGFAYVGVGDGGSSGDPQNNAQNVNNRLGKILRLARNPDPFAGASPIYYIPAPGNPFAGGGGDPWIFAYGLRNPFRASFSGNRLIIGDVGQGAVEEISMMTTAQGGRNFGWRFVEGTQPFTGTAPAGLTPPVTEYRHGTGPREGNSVTGGYVYRGPVTELVGRYIFGDFVRGNIWSVPLTSLVDGQTLSSSRYERRNADFAPDVGTINQIASFGEDSAGNLYIVDFDGDIFMIVPG